MQDISKVGSDICMTEFVLTPRPAMLLCFRRVSVQNFTVGAPLVLTVLGCC